MISGLKGWGCLSNDVNDWRERNGVVGGCAFVAQCRLHFRFRRRHPEEKRDVRLGVVLSVCKFIEGDWIVASGCAFQVKVSNKVYEFMFVDCVDFV